METRTSPPGVSRAGGPSAFPTYPIAIALGLVIVVMDVSGVSPFAVLRTLVVTGLAVGIVVVVGTIVLGDRHRGGVMGVLGLVALVGGNGATLLPVALAVALLLAERFVFPADRRIIPWPRIGRFASRVTVILLLAVAIQAVQLGSPGRIWRAVEMETAVQPGPAPVIDPTDPDIYLILLDGHVRLDVAQEVFGLDPAPFRDGLVDRRFTIADRSRSNYAYTSQTLASMLDQDHLADIPRMAGLLDGTESRPIGAVVQGVINDNRTIAILRSRGYEIEALAPGFEQVSLREADRFIDTGQMNEFEFAMLRRSAVNALAKSAFSVAASAQHRDRVLDLLDAVATAPARASDRPTMVFAHIPSPHEPWVFHADGSPRSADVDSFYAEAPGSVSKDPTATARAYADAVTYIDRQVLDTIDRLDASIAARGRPSVTIIFSDHGSWIGTASGGNQLRFKNLIAVRGDAVPLTVDPDMTLVNLMPSLFEQLFGMPWQRRADTMYQPGPRDLFDLEVVDAGG